MYFYKQHFCFDGHGTTPKTGHHINDGKSFPDRFRVQGFQWNLRGRMFELLAHFTAMSDSLCSHPLSAMVIQCCGEFAGPGALLMICFAVGVCPILALPTLIYLLPSVMGSSARHAEFMFHVERCGKLFQPSFNQEVDSSAYSADDDAIDYLTSQGAVDQGIRNELVSTA
jgi:hypothetical protein